MSLQTGELFGKPDFSDVTIRYGNHELPCHKLILCTNEYFRRLCGPNSQFIVSAAFCPCRSDVHLLTLVDGLGEQAERARTEDSPDALFDVLRYIYTRDSRADYGRERDWRHQFEVLKTARKYLLPDLATAAFLEFKTNVLRLRGPNDVHQALQLMQEVGDDDRVLGVARTLEDRHVYDLLKLPDYRAEIQSDPSTTFRHLDRCVDFKSGLVQVKIMRCSWCKAGKQVVETTQRSHCRSCSRWLESDFCWISKGKAEDWVAAPF